MQLAITTATITSSFKVFISTVHPRSSSIMTNENDNDNNNSNNNNNDDNNNNNNNNNEKEDEC